jgi:hypothetical protein
MDNHTAEHRQHGGTFALVFLLCLSSPQPIFFYQHKFRHLPSGFGWFCWFTAVSFELALHHAAAFDAHALLLVAAYCAQHPASNCVCVLAQVT